MILGVPHPDYLVEVLDARQLSEWEAFLSLEPLGEERADLRMANQMTLIANIHRDSKRKTSPYGLKDFLFDFEGREEKREEDPQKLAEKIKHTFKSLSTGKQKQKQRKR